MSETGSELNVLEARHRVTRALQSVFDAAGFLEVTTPVLQDGPGLEPHIKPFSTVYQGPFAEPPETLYLHTSPEMDMKRLLAAGASKIYQFAQVFRNGETSPIHTPEFTMLEWYETGADMVTAINRTLEIIEAAFELFGQPSGPVRRLTVGDLFESHFGIDLFATISPRDSLSPDPGQLAAALEPHGIRLGEGARWDDYFHAAMMAGPEQTLGQTGPDVVFGYPVCLGALARRNEMDLNIADRFEVYLSGVELANGYAELTDATDLAERRKVWEAQAESRTAPEAFLAMMSQGMPDAAGVALGFDRLMMLILDRDDVRSAQVVPGPVRGPVD